MPRQVILKLLPTEPRELRESDKWEHVSCFDTRAVRVERCWGEVCSFGDDRADDGAKVRVDRCVWVRRWEEAKEKSYGVEAQARANMWIGEVRAEQERGRVQRAGGDDDLRELVFGRNICDVDIFGRTFLHFIMIFF